VRSPDLFFTESSETAPRADSRGADKLFEQTLALDACTFSTASRAIAAQLRVRRGQHFCFVPAERSALRFAHRTWPGA